MTTLADIAALESSLRRHTAVRECVVRRRDDEAGRSIVVAYVVADRPVVLQELGDFARNAGCSLVPDAHVHLLALPLLPSGQLDERRLVQLPVIEDGALEHCRVELRRIFGDSTPLVTRGWGADGAVEDPAPDFAGGADVLARTLTPLDAKNGSPSISRGAPLVVDTLAHDLFEALQRAGARFPGHDIALIGARPTERMTYVELEQSALRVAAGLAACGVSPGSRVLLQLDDNTDFLRAFWGCVAAGAVPVLLPVASAAEQVASASRLRNVVALLEHPTVVTSHALRTTVESGLRSAGAPDVPVACLEDLIASAPALAHRPDPDDLAVLLLTSGSTGTPKAVMQTHRALLSEGASLAQRNGFTSADVLMNWMPLEHIGGIMMSHLLFVHLGGRQVHARTDYILQDPLRWIDAIDEHRATYTWAPSFAYGLVAERVAGAGRSWDLRCLRFILNAGEAVMARTARRFLKLLAPFGLPFTAMHPAWGMSETCSAVTFFDGFHELPETALDRAVPVGPPSPGVDLRIVDKDDRPLPNGSVGRLQVRGVTTTRGYLRNEQANADAFTSDGWFKTGDLGTLDDGALTITGRENGVIIINGGNYHAHEVEASVEEVPGVSRSYVAAFAARADGAETDELAIAFHCSAVDEATLRETLRRVRASVLADFGVAPRYLLPVEQREIPKTDIGKLQRAALAKRFREGGFTALQQRVRDLESDGADVGNQLFRRTWRRRDAHRVAARLEPGCACVLIGGSVTLQEALAQALHGCGATEVRRFASHQDAIDAPAWPLDSSSIHRLLVVCAESAADDGETADLSGASWRLISLMQAIGQRAALPVRVIVQASRAQALTESEHPAGARAGVLGIVRTLGTEYPQVRVRHIDVPPGEPEPLLIDRLMAEIEDSGDEKEVAYRDGQRWVPRLTRFSAGGKPSAPTGHGSFHVVTGGLGGIGVEVCRHLLSQARTPVLILGRSPLRDTADARAERFAELRALGEVHYEAIDIGDAAALERCIADAVARWGGPPGLVYHLAGTFEPRLIANETRATLAEAFRGKAEGARNLARTLAAYPNAELALFSSVNGSMGGFGAGAYSAANAVLDAMAHEYAQASGLRVRSLAWSHWEGIGLSRDFVTREAAERHGFLPIERGQGLRILAALSAGGPRHAIIGLDAKHPAIRRQCGVVSAEVLKVTLESTLPAQSLPTLADRFGRPIGIELVRRERDRSEGSRGGRPSDPEPRSELEGRIASIWCDVLGRTEVGLEDNFFDLGGTSLLVAALSNKLQTRLGRPVGMTDIYRYPTVRAFARHHAGNAGEHQSLDLSEDRGRQRRERRRLRTSREA